jgi:hypothetical protein
MGKTLIKEIGIRRQAKWVFCQAIVLFIHLVTFRVVP